MHSLLFCRQEGAGGAAVRRAWKSLERGARYRGRRADLVNEAAQVVRWFVGAGEEGAGGAEGRLRVCRIKNGFGLPREAVPNGWVDGQYDDDDDDNK